MAHKLKILIIDPFHSGSHAYWSSSMKREWSGRADVEITLLTLPGRHWKWRMQGSSAEFALTCSTISTAPDAIICTDMLDVSSFRGLLRADWREIPLIQYFHENQITYPWSPDDPDMKNGRDRTYGMMNILSAMASDALWFNSEFHRKRFLAAIPDFLRPFPDGIRAYNEHHFERKSAVLPLGIHAAGTADLNRPCKEAPTILWNHRWEFDKAPDYFRNVLLDFKKHKMPFSLILTGEQFDSIPPPLLLIQEEFHQEILHQGYAKSREEYEALLDRSDFVIHSPKQENFGISVLEAMSKGVIPLLGEGTAYDDWCEGSFITSNPTTIRERFVNYAANPAPYRNLAKQIAQRFDWDKVIPLYNEATNEIVNS